ncbi:hypothetical protein ScPMuIL_006618 [Solemya velum]
MEVSEGVEYLPIEVDYLYEDLQKIHASTAQNREIVEDLQKQIQEMKQTEMSQDEIIREKDKRIASLERDNSEMLRKLNVLTHENWTLKIKTNEDIAAHLIKDAALSELSARKEEVCLMQKQLRTLSEELDEYQYKNGVLEDEKEALTRRGDNLTELLEKERKHSNDLEYKFSFVFNINELLKTQQKTELQKRLNLERKLQILSAESTATGQTSGRYFLLEPSPLSTCVRCRACLARSEQNTTSCRYHSHLPLRYPAWKHFADSLTSPHNHKTHYKYWPCCRYLGIVEPDGCKEESTHIFHS